MVLLGIKLSVFECLVRDKCTPRLTVGLIKCLNSGHIIILQVQKACQAELADHATHFSSLVQFSCSVVSNSLLPHGLQLTRLPCPSPAPRACSNSCPLSLWCHPTISSSVIPFSSCLQSFPASGSFPVSQLFASGGLSIGASASASILLMNSHDWSPLGWTGLISVQSKGVSRAFSNTTVQKYQFFGPQPSLWSNGHIHTRLLEKP